MMTVKEVQKECRMYAKKAGLVFKKMDLKINGAPAYKFTSRKTGRVVLSNCALSSAYDNCLSSYIDTLNK